MQQNCLVSIIIPVYNAQKYIKNCLESLSAQTYKNIEIICVDDCSKDKSKEIIEEYLKNDLRAKLYSTKKNSGPATARNIGLYHAQGEYIMFCDNDDSYCADMVEKMVFEIKNNDVELVTCKANVINKDFDIVLANYVNSNPAGKMTLNDCAKTQVNVLLWNKIYKKDIIDKYEIKFPDGISGEDDAFVIQYVSAIKKYSGLKDYLYNYLLSETSYTNTIARGKDSSKKFDRIKVIEYFYNFLEKHELLNREEGYFRSKVRAELMYMLNYNNGKGDRKKVISLYNDFVKNAKYLDYKKYNFNTFYKRSYKRTNPILLFDLINKCYWF